MVLKLGQGFFNGIGVFFGADGAPQATIAHLLPRVLVCFSKKEQTKKESQGGKSPIMGYEL